MRIDNGNSEAAQGEAPNADLTLETTWRDWIDMSIRGADPRRAMLQRKLRPRGSLRTLWRMQRIFPASRRLEPAEPAASFSYPLIRKPDDVRPPRSTAGGEVAARGR